MKNLIVIVFCLWPVLLSAQTSLYLGRAVKPTGQETPVASSGGSAPEAPVALPASVTNGHSWTANWSASAGATGYYVEAGSTGFGDWVTNATLGIVWSNVNVGNVTSTNVWGTAVEVANSTIFQYRIRAYNGYGTSGNSSPISVTTLSPPGDPGITGAFDNSDCTIYIEWGWVGPPPTYDVMFQLYSTTGPTLVSTVYSAAGATSRYVTTPGTDIYFIVVTGRNADDNSANSPNPATSDGISVTCP